MSKTMKRMSALFLIAIMIAAFMPMMQEETFAAAKKPGKVAGLKIKKAGKKITVTWKKAKNAKKVQVIIKQGKKTVAKKAVKLAKKKYVFKKADYGQTYKVQVYALNGKKKGKATTKNVKMAILKLKHKDWNKEVKDALNAMMEKEAWNNQYVVFDFDNTCSIFDVEEQLAIYQLQKMAFASDLTPEKLPDILKTEIDMSVAEVDNDGTAESKNTYQDWIDDIVAAYTKLYKAYGPFSPKGLDDAKAKEVQATDDWKEFATKMRAMYDTVYATESAAIAYPWVLYWFTGMTEQEVYDLAYASHDYYRGVDTTREKWVAPELESAKVKGCTYTWTSGTQVSENIQELYKALDSNGIDVWVCSASATDPIRAAIDVWGLHDYVTGMMAMTNKLSGGKYINAYDWEGGNAWFAEDKGAWKKDTVKQATQTQGEGKVIAVQNVLYPKYKNHGPIAGFMDSTGDYNFCTEFKTLQVVTCFNRADRKPTDGGGVIAELAVYQADTLKMNYANRGEDTLYVLQGRNETGKRSFNPRRTTTIYKRVAKGDTKEYLFRSDYDDADNAKQLQAMVDNKMTTKDVIDTFAIKTSKDDSKYGFKYGFVTGEKGKGLGARFSNGFDFRGYHTQK